MPATGTAINGCDAVIRMRDSAGAYRNVSGSSNNFTLDLQNEIGEFKPFGTDWKVRLTCGKDATLQLDVIYSTANDEGFDLIRNLYFTGTGRADLQINLPDGSIGSDRYEANYVLESFSIPAQADSADPIMVSSQWRPNGEVTYSVVAT